MVSMTATEQGAPRATVLGTLPHIFVIVSIAAESEPRALEPLETTCH
jgi:hypothetical protein